ncbi:MAG TPA: nucleotide pyrophosphohydrolase [Kiritimatiellia bacterium]|nr:nucleotide pyrophosphohydrolase [Kiritimatiellia bacterium]HRZ11303.1 nucleotide pyrophosphohydrolase [Kiritimatiellia bacterium]HSA17146.1 nucleotide pyrophosphohydrolase [Kiritimatiellia bacterium]
MKKYMPRELAGLAAKIRRFNRHRDWDKYHAPKNLAMGVMIEAAELAEHFLWQETAESRRPDARARAAIRDEVGDVLILLLNLCDKLDIDPVAAALNKLEHNRRKYPAALVRGKALKYDQYPERAARGTKRRPPLSVR